METMVKSSACKTSILKTELALTQIVVKYVDKCVRMWYFGATYLLYLLSG